MADDEVPDPENIRVNIDIPVPTNPDGRWFLHVTAGDEDWQPSEEELAMIVALFQGALDEGRGKVIATRPNIAVSLIEMPFMDGDI